MDFSAFDNPVEPRRDSVTPSSAPDSNKFAVFDDSPAAVDTRFADEPEPEDRIGKANREYRDNLAALGGDKAKIAAMPGFLRKAYESAKGGARAVGHVAKDIGGQAVQDARDIAGGNLGAAFRPISASKRRELERGIDDMVTLGYGQRIAARIGNALGDVPERALGPETFGGSATPDSLFFNGGAPVANTQEADAAAAPGYRAAGELAGGFIPGAASVLGKAAGTVAGKALPALPGVAGTAATGTARGVAGYELSAPAVAGLSANAEGDRAGAAEKAAGDPLGLLTAGIGGAATSGAGGVAKGKIAARAEKAARQLVADEIGGEVKGASTPTARKQLADDAEATGRLVLADRKLDHAIGKARSGGIDAIGNALEEVRSRLGEKGARLSPGWADVDAALPSKMTSGEVVDYIEGRAQELRDTGHTTDAAEADALDAISGRLKKAKAWGASKVDVPPEAVAPQIADLEKVRANVRDPNTRAQLDQEISRLREGGHTITKFDPMTPIPIEQLQKLWSDEAGIAYNSQGGINGTATFQRKLDVASHLRELRDQALDLAAQRDPKAVAAIAGDLKDYSALKRIEKVLSERLNSAKAKGEGAIIPAGIKRKIKEIKHSPAGFVAGEGLELGAKGIEWATKAIARRADRAKLEAIWDAKKPGAAALAAIRAGVPRQVAIWAAAQASRGVSLDDALESAQP